MTHLRALSNNHRILKPQTFTVSACAKDHSNSQLYQLHIGTMAPSSGAEGFWSSHQSSPNDCLKIRHAPIINFHCEHGNLGGIPGIPIFRQAQNGKGPSTCQPPIGKLGFPLCFSLSCPLSGLGSSGIIWDAANIAVLATINGLV